MGVAACAPGSPGAPVAVVCETVQGGGGEGLLTLDVRLGDAGARPKGRLIVRVDPLNDPGAVHFAPEVPRTAAAAALAVTADGTFHGCLGEAPVGFRLHAGAAPRGRLWVRVSSDRAVAVRLFLPDGVRAEAASNGGVVRVDPGASLSVRWGPENGARQ